MTFDRFNQLEEESSASLTGDALFGTLEVLRKSLLLPYLKMVFDMLDSLEEESSTSFTGDALFEILEVLKKSVLLPY